MSFPSIGMTDEEPLNRIGIKISLVTVELTNDPTVDENSTILTSSYCVAIVTIMRPDSMSKVQGRSVSTKEEEGIIAYLENSLVRRTLFHFVAAVSMAAASMVSAVHAAVVSFGSGTNVFQMEFVTIGNPGNANDTTGTPNPAGRVTYKYDIGKFEVSRAMVDAYNLNPGVVAITLPDMTSFGGNVPNRPAAGIAWNEAARFVNWLNTSTGGVVAYKYADGDIATNLTPWTSADTLDYDASNPYRSIRAKYFLPSYNEWYKAAYYDPTNSTYYDYATGSDTAPTSVTSGTTAGTAVYGHIVFQGPADVDQAGGLSPYGVMGLGGNADEWEESSFDLANSSGSSLRAHRGGSWNAVDQVLSSSFRIFGINPSADGNLIGFRVASLPSSAAAVPEPSMMVIGTLFGIGGLMAKRRMMK
jgi:sulfatase modifying factor 1